LAKLGLRVLLKVLLFSHLVCLIAACDKSETRSAGETSLESNEVAKDSFTCDPEAPQEPTHLQRLSKFELKNSLLDLVGKAVLDAVGPEIDSAPSENRKLDFDTVDLPVFADHVASFNIIATRIAEEVAKSDVTLAEVAGGCAIQPNVSDGCVSEFIRAFGFRAFRTPLTPTRVSEIKADFWDGAKSFAERERLQMIISFILQSPEFQYRIEIGTRPEPSSSSLYSISDFELASRLSFLLWGRTPDAELLEVANRGELSTEAGFNAQLERMVNHRFAVANFEHFVQQWLQLEHIPSSNAIAPFLSHPATGPMTNENVESLPPMASQEILDLVSYFTWTKEGNYFDLMTTDLAMARAFELAEKIYGVPVWNGKFGPQDLVHFSDGGRKGLLTRAAFLIHEDEKSRPLLRGVFVRRKILCDEIPDPDPNQLPVGSLDPPPVLPSDTTRMAFEKKTSSAVCMSCHSMINPLGFPFEYFDALGRVNFAGRERRYSSDGKLVDSPLVNTSAKVLISEPTTVDIQGPADLIQLIASDPKSTRCLAAKWFRYSMGREESHADGCALRQIHSALARSNGTIKGMIRETARIKFMRYLKKGN
jgi:hypothetical protein